MTAFAMRLGHGLALCSGAAMALILLVLVCLDAVQVVQRYVLGTGWPWAGDLAVILLLSLAWLGAGHLLWTGAHIAVDLLSHRPRLRSVLGTALDTIVLIGGAIMFPLTLDAMAVYGMIDLPALPLPASAKYLPVAVGTFYVALAAALRLVARRGT